MIKNFSKNTEYEIILYNNILLLSRNELFYTKFNLSDTFQNRIILIFIHVSFLFIKIRTEKEKDKYEVFYQNVFDVIFKNIEVNMREIGYGDVTINKNMKSLVKTFYNILLYCEKFTKETSSSKKDFLIKYLEQKTDQKNLNNPGLINYFNVYQAFCLDLSSDSVLKGVLNFKYK